MGVFFDIALIPPPFYQYHLIINVLNISDIVLL